MKCYNFLRVTNVIITIKSKYIKDQITPARDALNEFWPMT